MDNLVQSATLLAFALLATSCASKSVSSPEIRLQRWGLPAIPFTMLSNFHEPSQRAIRTQEEWNEVWDNLGSGSPGAATPPPPIDFHHETVVMAAMGSQPNNGYSVVVERAYRCRNSVIVVVREEVPSDLCSKKTDHTQPVDIARIGATPESIRFEVRRVETCR